MERIEELETAARRYDENGMPEKTMLCLEKMNKIDYKATYSVINEFKDRWTERSKQKKADTRAYMRLVRSLYILGARHYFEDFLIALEFDVPYRNKFYLPRRDYLRRHGIIQGYQSILDGECDLLTISLPKRAGKSQCEINFVAMLSGMYPARSSLIEGVGDDLINSFYTGCLDYFTNDIYSYREIFPDAGLVRNKADTHIIDLGQPSRFPTIMCRSIDARQIGLSEATNVLCLDDCVEGREEAKNRMRLENKWEIINGDILGRALEGTPVVATGTRYSIYDPIGKLQARYDALGKRRISIEVPALDPVTDESNYEYYNPKLEKKQFTTQYFRDERASLSEEQFASEFQQQPFEAKGVLFPTASLKRFFELPVDKDPDYIFAVCDTAEGGGDYVSLPVAYIYGDDVFIADLVYDNSTPEVTKPEVAYMMTKHKVGNAVFESNLAGTYFARDVEELMKKAGGKCSITTARTVTNKKTRIELASDYILKHFYFLDESCYKPASQYGQAIRELTTYTRQGKTPHDDFTDSLAILENKIRDFVGLQIQVIQRPF